MAKATKQLNQENKLVKAHARNLRIAPRKLRLVTNLIKQMPVEKALIQLQFLNKKGAPMVDKLIRSAIANAVNNFSLRAEDLFVQSLTCDQGPVMMRYMPRARGSASPIRRKTSHLHVVLENRPSKAKKSSQLQKILKAKQTEDESSKQDKENPEAKRLDTEKARPAVAPKSSEKTKANTVQQKRRLFNRRTGE